ncbi:MAG: hypothetical protein ACRBF0_12545 [Calditrichia bacterium]
MKSSEHFIREILEEFSDIDGNIVFAPNPDIGKVRERADEYRLILEALAPESNYLMRKFDDDPVFRESERDASAVIHSLVVYCKTTLKLLDNGVLQPRGMLLPAPEFHRLTDVVPGLHENLSARWREAQICRNVGANLSAVVQMGSIIEALLLCRTIRDDQKAFRARQAPRQNESGIRPLQDWNFDELVAVAFELDWLQISGMDIPLPLRTYHSLTNALSQTTTGASIDKAMINACWKVLNRCIEELLASV